jgi:5-methylcytosine-specific restriction endonuclease McrA
MDRLLEELIWRRAGGCCEYCRTPQEVEDLPAEIDHILAEVHGGRLTASNLALFCLHCNRHKVAQPLRD